MQIINSLKLFLTTDFSSYRYITVELVSRKLKINQPLAKLILEYCLWSKMIGKVYYVKHPNKHLNKRFGPYVTTYDIPDEIDQQHYDGHNFIVTNDLIEAEYTIL